MITRELLDENRTVLMNLHSIGAEQALYVRRDGLPGLSLAGSTEYLAGGSVAVYAGSRAVRAGGTSLDLALAGRTATDLRELLNAVLQALSLTRWYRVDGWELPVTGGFVKGEPRYRDNNPAQNHALLSVEFQPVWPYWLGNARSVDLVAGANAVTVESLTPVGVRLALTAAAEVAQPRVTFPDGAAAWLDLTAPAGAVIVLDASPGAYQITVNGVDQSLAARGDLPELRPGGGVVTLSAGLSGVLTYRPGMWVPEGQITPDVQQGGEGGFILVAKEW